MNSTRRSVLKFLASIPVASHFLSVPARALPVERPREALPPELMYDQVMDRMTCAWDLVGTDHQPFTDFSYQPWVAVMAGDGVRVHDYTNRVPGNTMIPLFEISASAELPPIGFHGWAEATNNIKRQLMAKLNDKARSLVAFSNPSTGLEEYHLTAVVVGPGHMSLSPRGVITYRYKLGMFLTPLLHLEEADWHGNPWVGENVSFGDGNIVNMTLSDMTRKLDSLLFPGHLNLGYSRVQTAKYSHGDSDR